MLRSKPKFYRKACFGALTALGIATVAMPASANQGSEYFVVEQRLPDFIRELTTHTGARIQLTDASRGWIRNANLSGDVSDILTSLETELELDWFEYNDVYFVSKKSEAVTRMVRLGDLEFSDVNEKLESSGFPVDRFRPQSVSDGSALIVTGPPRLLAFVEAAIESIPAKPGRAGIIVRRGIHVGGEAVDVTTE